MPQNFPELWLGTVKKLFSSLLSAAWLDGIAEIPSNPMLVNPGTDTEKNIIYVPTTVFAPDVLVNNTVYPLDTQSYADGTISLTLDKYQTKVTTISDDDVMGASYDKIKEVTIGHVEKITGIKYVKALHSIAPVSTTTTTPVMVTTGETVGTRKRCTYDDLVNFKALLDANDCNPEGRRLVLCSDHWNDLLLDRKNFGDKFINYQAGTVLNVLNFEIFPWIQCPKYTTAGAKVAWGAIAPVGSKQGSVFFQKDNIGKKTGVTKQYYTPSQLNPKTQTNDLAYRHYFVAIPYLNNYIGAIISATV